MINVGSIARVFTDGFNYIELLVVQINVEYQEFDTLHKRKYRGVLMPFGFTGVDCFF